VTCLSQSQSDQVSSISPSNFDAFFNHQNPDLPEEVSLKQCACVPDLIIIIRCSVFLVVAVAHLTFGAVIVSHDMFRLTPLHVSEDLIITLLTLVK